MPEFIAFNFHVNLYNEENQEMLCQGLFSEVSGLELTMEPKVISEGGRNWGEIQRVGTTKFSPIVLKRGITQHNDLWSWFDTVSRGNNYGYRMQGEIVVYGPGLDDSKERIPAITWKLGGVLPTKFKGADLSSTAAQVAIEEVHLAIESLTIERPNSSTSSANSNTQQSGASNAIP